MAAREEGTPTGEGEELPVAEEPSIVQEHDASSRGTPHRGGQAGDNEEVEFHTGVNRPTGVPDAIEFIGVHKSFGSNHVLRG